MEILLPEYKHMFTFGDKASSPPTPLHAGMVWFHDLCKAMTGVQTGMFQSLGYLVLRTTLYNKVAYGYKIRRCVLFVSKLL